MTKNKNESSDFLICQELENGWDSRFILGKLRDTSLSKRSLVNNDALTHSCNKSAMEVKRTMNNPHFSAEKSIDHRDTAQKNILAKKAVQQREQLIAQLHLVVNNWPVQSRKINTATGQKQKSKSSKLLQNCKNRLEQLAKNLQHIGLKCIELIVSWLMNFHDQKNLFVYNGQNYLLKMYSDLDFVFETLREDAKKLGFHIANPLLLGYNYMNCEEINRLAIAQMVIEDASVFKKESTEKQFKVCNNTKRVVNNTFSKATRHKNRRNYEKDRTKQQPLQETSCSFPKIENTAYQSSHIEGYSEKVSFKRQPLQQKTSCFLPKIQNAVHNKNNTDHTNQSLNYEDCSDFTFDDQTSQKSSNSLTSIDKAYYADKEINEHQGYGNIKSNGYSSIDTFDSGTESDNDSDNESLDQKNLKAMSYRNSMDKTNDGEYSIISLLGEGAFGVVYHVRNKINLQEFAMKKFKKLVTSEEDDASEAFYQEREVEICQKLNQHTNIIQMVEVTEFQGEKCIVFELMPINCLALISDNPKGLDKSTVLSLSKQLLLSVEYCHGKNVIHRDIKPENILIEKQEQSNNGNSYLLKLCDFGTSRYLTENEINYLHGTTAHKSSEKSTPLTYYVGSRWYRAPEQLGNSTHYTFAIDIWAIACIIYEISFGLPLFCGDDENEVIDNIASVVSIPYKILQLLQQRGFLDRRRSINKTTSNHGEEESEPFHLIASKLGKNSSSLFKGMLQVDPDERFSASKCLSSDFFHKMNSPLSDLKPSTSIGAVDDDYKSNDYEEDSEFEKDDSYSEESISNCSSLNSYNS